MIERIIDKIKNNNEITTVSFDIFDTLLLRTVSEPTQVFSRMFQLQPELFPEYTNEDDWKNARIYAERMARKKAYEQKKNYEVTLDKIYEEISFVYTQKQKLMSLEIECESMTCFLNDAVYETLKYIKQELKLKVLLISDMYLSKDVITNILSGNNVDCSLFDGIYISCEYDASKKYSELYQIAMNESGIAARQLLHVGDNHYSDIGVARKLGISTYQYTLISEADYRFPYINLERKAYGEICKEIYSLRLLAANENSEDTEEEKFFFDIGAMILGPIFTYATEWILDEAVKRNIKIIRPLMREGKLLSELLIKAQEERNIELSIEPLYISRFAVFTANFEKCMEKDVLYLFNTYNITLRKIFEILNIEEVSEKYKEYLDISTVELKQVTLSTESVYEEIKTFLTSEEIILLIRKKNKGVSEKIVKYLREMGLEEACMTLDIGWRGSIQNTIRKLLGLNSGNMLNYLFFSRDLAIENVTEGCDLRGFIGNFGKQQKNIFDLFYRLIEMFCLNTDGTTIGYRPEGDKVVPQLQYIDYPAEQIKLIGILQQGIKAFQQEFFKLVKKKPYIREWSNYRTELCNLLERLFSYPLNSEATKLSTIVYDQNFGANSFAPMISQELISRCKKEGFARFYSKFRTTEIQWYSGLNVMVEAGYYYEMILNMNRNYYLYSLIMMCQRALNILGTQRIILVGGGNNAKTILKFLAAVDKLCAVEGIVDNNVDIHGSSIAGISISAVEEKCGNYLYLCTITNKVYRDSLYNQIESQNNDAFRFVSYFEEDDKV